MIKKWLQRIGWALIASLIAFNVYLLEKKHSKAERLNYIPKWERISNGDLVESFTVAGIVVPAETNPIFIDKSMEFDHFLVEKGEFVEVGTPLFAYANGHLDEQLTLLDAEITRLEAEVESIDSFINDLDNMQISLPTLSTGTSFTDTDLDRFAQEHLEQLDAVSERELIFSLEKKMAEMELEKERLELDIKAYEEQRRAIENGQSGLTILSPYEGIIATLSFNLSNPLITIVSERKAIEGILTEERIKDVEPGMRVNITSKLFPEHLTGVINTQDELPIDAPAIDTASKYRFYAELDNHDEELFVGYHVKTDIVTDEATNVPIVQQKSLFEQGEDTFLWVLKEDGIIEKREITPGLDVDNRQEVRAGAEPGEFYVLDSKQVEIAAPFITPFQAKGFSIDSWTKTRSKKILSHILIGVLQR